MTSSSRCTACVNASTTATSRYVVIAHLTETYQADLRSNHGQYHLVSSRLVSSKLCTTASDVDPAHGFNRRANSSKRPRRWSTSIAWQDSLRLITVASTSRSTPSMRRQNKRRSSQLVSRAITPSSQDAWLFTACLITESCQPRTRRSTGVL